MENTLGLSVQEASRITEDSKISGEEIWDKSQNLRQLVGRVCSTNLACQFAAGSHFIQKANEGLSAAAGENHVLDNEAEVNVLIAKFNSGDLLASRSTDELGQRLKEIQAEWPDDALNEAQITELMSQRSVGLRKPSDVVVQVAKVRDGTQDDGPSAVKTLAFLPSEGSVRVSRQTAMDFLITHIDNFPHVTSLYQSIDVRGSHDASDTSGSFQTTNTMVMQAFPVIPDATATFDTDIHWYEVAPENQISTIYFDFKPQNPVSGIVTVKAFTGKFIVRPVVDPTGREGLLFELYVYFDIDVPGFLKGIKNDIVSWLMSDRIKTFCQEIAYHYLESQKSP